MVSCALALCCVKYSPIYTRRQESVFTGVFVCLSVFRTISQKAMQLGSPNLTQKCSTMSPGNQFIWGQKFKGQGHESIGMGLCTLVNAGFFKFQDAFGVRLISKYLMKSSLKISPHLKCVAALPCEIFDTFLSVRWPLIFLSAALSMVLCLYDRPLQVCVLSKRLIGLIWILAQKLPPPRLSYSVLYRHSSIFKIRVLPSGTLSQILESEFRKFYDCTSTVTSAVNVSGHSVWWTGDGRRSPVYHTERPPLCTT